jgi:hypothetical protein
MRRYRDDLLVEVQDEEIVVWKPGTVFLVAFEKAAYQRYLVVKRSWLSGVNSKPLMEFRAHAVQLALNKARSLGWLVEAVSASNPATSNAPRSLAEPKKKRRNRSLLR